MLGGYHHHRPVSHDHFIQSPRKTNERAKLAAAWLKAKLPTFTNSHIGASLRDGQHYPTGKQVRGVRRKLRLHKRARLKAP